MPSAGRTTVEILGEEDFSPPRAMRNFVAGISALPQRSARQFCVDDFGPSRARVRRRRTVWPQVAALDRPAFVPRTTGRRQEMTGPAGASSPQVRNQIRPSPQVARSVPRTLSRWRHGFEPRWDYQGNQLQRLRCVPSLSRRARGFSAIVSAEPASPSTPPRSDPRRAS
jgi:hypothetical protein